jgi:diketogulonate reductase-like aldo/keto reductase
LNIAFIAYGPLGGRAGAGGLGDRHPVLAAVGGEHGVSPQQVALAWELAQSRNVIVIPGGRRIAPFLGNAVADSIQLSDEELTRISTELSREPSLTGYADPPDDGGSVGIPPQSTISA